MGWFTGGGNSGNEMGGWVGGKHRGKPVKGKGGLKKPPRGKRGGDPDGGKWLGKGGAAEGWGRWD